MRRRRHVSALASGQRGFSLASNGFDWVRFVRGAAGWVLGGFVFPNGEIGCTGLRGVAWGCMP
jgi:hypothetical protein